MKDWEAARPYIMEYFWDQNHTLTETREYMKKHHGFKAAVRTYWHHLGLWGYRKNTRKGQSADNNTTNSDRLARRARAKRRIPERVLVTPPSSHGRTDTLLSGEPPSQRVSPTIDTLVGALPISAPALAESESRYDGPPQHGYADADDTLYTGSGFQPPPSIYDRFDMDIPHNFASVQHSRPPENERSIAALGDIFQLPYQFEGSQPAAQQTPQDVEGLSTWNSPWEQAQQQQQQHQQQQQQLHHHQARHHQAHRHQPWSHLGHQQHPIRTAPPPQHSPPLQQSPQLLRSPQLQQQLQLGQRNQQLQLEQQHQQFLQHRQQQQQQLQLQQQLIQQQHQQHWQRQQQQRAYSKDSSISHSSTASLLPNCIPSIDTLF